MLSEAENVNISDFRFGHVNEKLKIMTFFLLFAQNQQNVPNNFKLKFTLFVLISEQIPIKSTQDESLSE